MRAALTALATGILVFLFWDVLAHGVEPVEAALEAHDWGRVRPLAALLAGGFTVGLMSLVYYDRWMKRQARHAARRAGRGRGRRVRARARGSNA